MLPVHQPQQRCSSGMLYVTTLSVLLIPSFCFRVGTLGRRDLDWVGWTFGLLCIVTATPVHIGGSCRFALLVTAPEGGKEGGTQKHGCFASELSVRHVNCPVVALLSTASKPSSSGEVGRGWNHRSAYNSCRLSSRHTGGAGCPRGERVLVRARLMQSENTGSRCPLYAETRERRRSPRFRDWRGGVRALTPLMSGPCAQTNRALRERPLMFLFFIIFFAARAFVYRWVPSQLVLMG